MIPQHICCDSVPKCNPLPHQAVISIMVLSDGSGLPVSKLLAHPGSQKKKEEKNLPCFFDDI